MKPQINIRVAEPMMSQARAQIFIEPSLGLSLILPSSISHEPRSNSNTSLQAWNARAQARLIYTLGRILSYQEGS